MRTGLGPSNPLLKQAGFKASEAFLKWQKKRFAKRFPAHVHANAKSMNAKSMNAKSMNAMMTEDNDNQVQDLTNTWIDKKQVNLSLDSLPTEGESSLLLWSSDYWRTQWGQTAYRYSGGEEYGPTRTRSRPISSRRSLTIS